MTRPAARPWDNRALFAALAFFVGLHWIAVCVGSTGHWPVPSGDSPDGTGGPPTHSALALEGWLLVIPVGESPTGTGESPVLPMQNPFTATATALAALPTNGLPLKPLGPGLFGLGLVRLDQRERTVSFPAFVNTKEQSIEYLVVASTGKTHESLLRTDARPQDIQLAFLLLGAKGAGTNALPQDPAQPLPGDKVTLEISWKEDGVEQRHPAEEFVRPAKTSGPISPGAWIYNGSRLREDGFAAELDGSIVSLITDADALVNNPRPGREDDDYWKPRAERLPPVNSPVKVSIRLSR